MKVKGHDDMMNGEAVARHPCQTAKVWQILWKLDGCSETGPNHAAFGFSVKEPIWSRNGLGSVGS
jgi:hypothetical protein